MASNPNSCWTHAGRAASIRAGCAPRQFTRFGYSIAIHRAPDGTLRCTGLPWETTCQEVGGVVLVAAHDSPVPDRMLELLDRSWMESSIIELPVPAPTAEVQENTPDLAHFQVLHGPHIIGATDAVADISPDGTFTTSARFLLRNGGDMRLSARCFDPKSMHTTSTNPFGTVETIAIGADVGERNSEWIFVVQTQKCRVVSLLRNRVLRATVKRAIQQDIPIWEKKIWLNRPILSDGDVQLRLYRRWLALGQLEMGAVQAE